MDHHLKPVLEINLATIFIATSGILGKLITLSPVFTILIRSLLAIVFLFVFMKISRTNLTINFKSHFGFFIISGICIAGHWVLYFFSIQISTVAVAVISLFTYPVITTLLEPLFFKTKMENINIISSIIVLIGVIIIVPNFDINDNITLGVLVGILSSILYSCRNLLSKKYIEQYSGMTILTYQLIVAAILLSPFGYYFYSPISSAEIGYLLFLGLVTTALGHMLFVRSLKHFSTSTVSIISSLQPVYAIVLAVIIIDEPLNTQVIIGGGLILTVVLIQNYLAYNKVSNGR